MFFRTARRSVGKADSTLLWGPPLEGQKIFQNEAFYIKTLVRKRPTLFSPFPFLEDAPSTFVGAPQEKPISRKRNPVFGNLVNHMLRLMYGGFEHSIHHIPCP